ncbi:MAG: type I methionyl aminopeptidase [Porticoccus sp.]|uniref:Methionine aminopeptidase n=1 Tax=PS1 clade bacterium TaxID=2175152 RepID=A0A368DMV5_9PROT|nr:type I methionyl aminopeptidase [Porticoccus sp.]MAU87432.1 type I methionyl aminopeptidase [Rhodobiaceae bacterium]OUT73655.1 MAG: type I methionyl aminopeptidase [Rhizobiales bacterium TMED25]RCL73178.1 MAG: type I methionyl aminopeptidase [PS1 clade bacterium]|tara:strand:+ start:4700 stop:5494 length:795 start_codon:yes stop_codon:yes gene_type:complete
MNSYIKASNAPMKNIGLIKLYNNDDFSQMKKAGKLVAECLNYIEPFIIDGVTTQYLDKLIYDFALSKNSIPATLNYRGYPASSCISLNNVICHGIPSNKKLKNGDILNIDITLILNGWHGDTSRMFKVGKISRKAEILIDTTYQCLMEAIHLLKPGIHTGDIGALIQEIAEGNRFSVVEDLCGHGIGQIFHDHPNILHFGKKGQGYELKEGMIFTIEPMINAGTKDIRLLSDGWTIVTKDKELSAQFEHTVGITRDGYQIFTDG